MPDDMADSEAPRAATENGGLLNEPGAAAPVWFSEKDQAQALRLDALRLAVATVGEDGDHKLVLSTARDYIDFVTEG